MTAAAGAVHQFRKRVRQSAGADIVYGQNRIGLPHRPAAVDHLLRAALHFRVAALHRVEIETFDVRAGVHAGGGPAAHADEQSRTADLYQERARFERGLVRLRRRNCPYAAGQHDRLVVAANLAVDSLFKSAEVAAEIRATELVVERRATDRPLKHDLQRRRNAARFSDSVLFPGLHKTGYAQVRDRESGESRLWLGATAGCTFIANLAAGTGGSAGERRDGGGVIMRLDFHQDMGRLAGVTIGSRGIRIEARDLRTLHDCRVVRVRHHRAAWILRVRVAHHVEQRLLLPGSVDDPVGIEDLVPAVLRIRLREHHQFYVGGVALHALEAVHQIIDFVLG